MSSLPPSLRFLYRFLNRTRGFLIRSRFLLNPISDGNILLTNMQIISLTQLFFSFIDASSTVLILPQQLCSHVLPSHFPMSLTYLHVPHISPCPSHFPMSLTFPHVDHMSPCRSHVPMSPMSPCPPCPPCPSHFPNICPYFPLFGTSSFPKTFVACSHFMSPFFVRPRQRSSPQENF